MFNVAVPPEEEFKDEFLNYDYLKTHNFEKSLEWLSKKLKNKKIILYGSGVFLRAINKYFDLSGLNIIGVCDKKFETNKEEKEFLGYKTLAPAEISAFNPDYVLITTKFYIDIGLDLKKMLKNTKIKVEPIVEKGFFELLKEALNK